MTAFVPELVVIGFAAAAVGIAVLYVRRESDRLDQRQGRRRS